jgi:hypothetical protein
MVVVVLRDEEQVIDEPNGDALKTPIDPSS